MNLLLETPRAVTGWLQVARDSFEASTNRGVVAGLGAGAALLGSTGTALAQTTQPPTGGGGTSTISGPMQSALTNKIPSGAGNTSGISGLIGIVVFMVLLALFALALVGLVEGADGRGWRKVFGVVAAVVGVPVLIAWIISQIS